MTLPNPSFDNGVLSKIIIYPVVYERDTDGNIIEETSGIKSIQKQYNQVNVNDDYTIITKILNPNE